MKRFLSTAILSILLFSLLPRTTHAGISACGIPDAIQLSIFIPFVTGKGTGEYANCYYLKKFGTSPSGGPGTLQDYIAGVYRFGVTIGGFLAAIMIMIGGARWVMAGGNPEKISRSKEQMLSAIVGLLLLLVSYTILTVINPALVQLGPLELQEVTPLSKEQKAVLGLVEERARRDNISPEEAEKQIIREKEAVIRSLTAEAEALYNGDIDPPPGMSWEGRMRELATQIRAHAAVTTEIEKIHYQTAQQKQQEYQNAQIANERAPGSFTPEKIKELQQQAQTARQRAEELRGKNATMTQRAIKAERFADCAAASWYQRNITTVGGTDCP